MTNYQVIARKYRPLTFTEVVGQHTVVTTLKNGLRLQKLAHAYLFCGCRGTGKTTLARIFAKALNCSELSTECEPCNRCSACLDVMHSRALDVIEIDGASHRGIDDIRQINENVGYAPTFGKYKIYIIDEVHMLTKEAFNALLKTLEEPPPHVKFFFATTEPHKVPSTILSRCQRFDLNRIPPELIAHKLSSIARDLSVECVEDIFPLLAKYAEGSLRDAESLLDQVLCYAEEPVCVNQVASLLGLMPKEVFEALDSAFAQQNLSYAFTLAHEVFSSGKDVSYFLDALIDHYHTILKHHLSGNQNAQPSPYSLEQTLQILDDLIHWQQQLHRVTVKQMHLEMVLLHIIRSKYRVTLPGLIKRLHELTRPHAQCATQTTATAPLSTLEKNTPPSLPIEALTTTIDPPSPTLDSTEPTTITATAPLSTLEKNIPPSPPIEALTTTIDPPSPTLDSTEPTTITATAPLSTLEKNTPPSPPIEALTTTIDPPSPTLDSIEPTTITATAPLSTLEKNIPPSLPIEALTTTIDPPSPTLDSTEPTTQTSATLLVGQQIEQSLHTAAPSDTPSTERPAGPSTRARYETLMHFAAIELEGKLYRKQSNI